MSNLDKFDHIVVLMLENHSFDSLMGYLYEHDAPARFVGDFGDAAATMGGTPMPPAFDGVAGKQLSNPAPDGREVPVVKAPYATQLDMCNPLPDPGEQFSPHVNTQLFGADPPPDPSLSPPMNGFVRDYVTAINEQRIEQGPVTEEMYGVIMRCFPPEAVPVLSGLARKFAVSDRWFASVPTQTFCNRSFFHSGQSNGFVVNADYVKWRRNVAPTIMNVLSDAGHDWRVYFDDADVLAITRAIHPSVFVHRFHDNFRGFSKFRADCEAGRLPAYTFIEPRLLQDHNDMHPPVSLNPVVTSSILAGELLVNEVYEAVRSNQELWERTLLIVLFDEHGGCYDHVPPPRATPPGLPVNGEPDSPPGGPFGFDRFGVRVPAIFVSPYIEEGTLVRAAGPVPFDHTSMIRTICEKWNLPKLGARDAAAPSLAPLLTRDTPRTDRAVFTPRPYAPQAEHLEDFLLTPHQEDWVKTFAEAIDAPLPETARTVGQAIAHLASALPNKLSRL